MHYLFYNYIFEVINPVKKLIIHVTGTIKSMYI